MSQQATSSFKVRGVQHDVDQHGGKPGNQPGGNLVRNLATNQVGNLVTNLVGSLVGVALAPLQELPLLSRLL